MRAQDTGIGPRGLIPILAFAFAVEGALYSAVTPILPVLSRQFGLSDSMAGVLLSSYSAGLIMGSLLCVLILKRTNPRNVAAFAMAALALMTIVFAWTDSSAVLMGSRLGQGIASGTTWTASIAWLLSAWPVERRGEALASAMSPAIVGTVAGPFIGTVGLPLGLEAPYTVVAVCCMAVTVLLFRMPRPARGHSLVGASITSKRSARTIAMIGAGAAALAGAVIGLVNLSGPLLLNDGGGSDYLSATAFLVAAVATIFAAKPLGRVVDRLGARRTTVPGLLILVVLLPLLSLDADPNLIALVIVALVVSNNFCYISASTLLTRAGQDSSWSLQFSGALLTTLWGSGETIGPLLGGLGLDTLGPQWTMVSSAVVVVVGLLIMVMKLRGHNEPVENAAALKEPRVGLGDDTESEPTIRDGS
jgi:predicted MFS family arabinose efflux permease